MEFSLFGSCMVLQLGVPDILSVLLVTGGLCQKKGGTLAQEGFQKLTGMRIFINVDFMYVPSVD